MEDREHVATEGHCEALSDSTERHDQARGLGDEEGCSADSAPGRGTGSRSAALLETGTFTDTAVADQPCYQENRKLPALHGAG